MTLPPRHITAEPDTRLEQLLAAYTGAKAAADAAAAELKTITDGIKAELATRAPGESKVAVSSATGPSLVLSAIEQWRIDAKRMKAENPELYVEWAVKSTSWQLRKVPS